MRLVSVCEYHFSFFLCFVASCIPTLLSFPPSLTFLPPILDTDWLPLCGLQWPAVYGFGRDYSGAVSPSIV
jgi:hypothetical protein